MIKVAMKSTKLFAVLAGMAMFTACTQEEVFEANNTPQQMEEIVGAKLVGTDVSLNVSMDETNSRWAGGEAKWEKEDVVGLGWITNGKPYDDQIVNGTPVNPSSNKLFANHMYNYDEKGSTWTTKGNIYEGWYFAYYPWNYMAKVGQKTFEVNPAQETADQVKHYGKRLFISSRQFIAAGEVNTDNTFEKQFTMLAAVKALRVKTNPAKESSFAKNEKMKAKKIEYITFSTGDEAKKIFASEVKLDPQNLPVWDETDVEASKIAFYDKLYADRKPVLSVDAENWSSTLTTKFKGEGQQPAFDDNRLLAYAVPATAELDIEKVSIKIGIEGGYFLINKNDKKNLAALQQFVDAYCGEDKEGCGSMTKIDANEGTSWAMTLDIELHDDIFFTDFTQISNYDQWKDAVDMVDILGREAESFEIVGAIDFANGIYMPQNGCELTVGRGNKIGLTEKESSSETLSNYFFNITGDMTGWPTNLKSSTIKVEIAEGVTVEDAHLISARQIVNYGTMNVPAEETLTSASQTLSTSLVKNVGEINLGYKSKVSRVNNAVGRINVIYGSYVELLEGTEAGEIAYIVNKEDATAPQRIKDVIAVTGTGTDRQYANVNILVFNKENVKEFDFTKATSGTPNDNPYYDNSTNGSEDVLNLNGVNLEINGVEVSSSSTEKAVTVKDITMNGGDVKNIAIAGNLTVKSGSVVATVTSIANNLSIEAGQGIITSETIGSVNIASGNFTVNAGTINGNVTATGENYFNVETIKGEVVLANNTNNATSIVGATIDGNVTLNGNFALESVTVNGNMTVNGVVKCNNIIVNGTLEVKTGAEFVIFGNDAKISHIDNYGKLTTFVDVYTETVEIFNGSIAVVADNKTIWYTKPSYGDYGYTQQGLTDGSILYLDVKVSSSENIQDAFQLPVANITLTENLNLNVEKPYLNVAAGSDVTLNGNNNTLTAGDALNYGLVARDGSTLVINDLGYKSQGGAVAAVNGSNVTFNSGNIEINSNSSNQRHIFYASGEGSEVIVNGGDFAFEAYRQRTYACAVNGAIIYIKDGNFGVAPNHQRWTHPIYTENGGQVIITGGTFRFDPTEWVAEGYGVEKNGEIWTVSKI